MKKLLLSFFFSLLPIVSVFAEDNILGIDNTRLRNGDISVNDIPLMIVSIIQFLMGIAASVAVVALIYHAVRMQLASGIT